jgi:hypothetical protein
MADSFTDLLQILYYETFMINYKKVTFSLFPF